jgi:hypothetical protein
MCLSNLTPELKTNSNGIYWKVFLEKPCDNYGSIYQHCNRLYSTNIKYTAYLHRTKLSNSNNKFYTTGFHVFKRLRDAKHWTEWQYPNRYSPFIIKTSHYQKDIFI